jgi:hypothetical protein
MRVAIKICPVCGYPTVDSRTCAACLPLAVPTEPHPINAGQATGSLISTLSGYPASSRPLASHLRLASSQ